MSAPASSSSSTGRTNIKSIGQTIQTKKRIDRFAELTAQKRADTHSKRRRLPEEEDGAAGTPEERPSDSQVQSILDNFRSCFHVTEAGPNVRLTTILPNANIPQEQRATALQAIRVLVSSDDAPLDAVVSGGIVPLLVSELQSCTDPAAQMDALWALTNIASGTTAHTRSCLSAAPTLIALLSSASLKIVQQCIWCLGNIASEEQDSRRQLLDNGILVPLVRILQQSLPANVPPPPAPVPPPEPAQRDLARVVAWTLSNLIKATRGHVLKVAVPVGGVIDASMFMPGPSHKHTADFDAAMPTLLPVTLALLRSEDEQLATECAWMLSAWANHSDEVLTKLCNNGLIEAVMSRLLLLQQSPLAATRVVMDAKTNTERDPLAPILIPLVRIIGNAAHAENEQILIAMLRLTFPVVPGAPPLPNGFHLVFSTLDRSLSSIHRGLKRETCWVISNLAATQVEDAHRALLISDNGPSAFLVQLYEILERGNFDVQREAAQAIYSLARVGEVKGESHSAPKSLHLVLPRHAPGQPGGDVTVRVLMNLFELMKSRDPEATFVSLRIIELILRFHPDGIKLVEENGGIDALESVQSHMENAELVDYAHKLNDSYFGVENEDTDGNQEMREQEEYPAWRGQTQQQQQQPKDYNDMFAVQGSSIAPPEFNRNNQASSSSSAAPTPPLFNFQ